MATNNTVTVNIAHNEFINNNILYMGLLRLGGIMVTVQMNEFIGNKAFSMMLAPYYINSENITNNVFIDNSAVYDTYISSFCRPGFSLSFGYSHCTQSTVKWLVWMPVFIVGGIVLVIVMLALNLTIAVGTLNGIFFYAHIVYADAYLLPSFKTPGFITVFLSWLNFDLGFDLDFYYYNDNPIYAIMSLTLIQLVFPAYVIVFVIIVIVASECSPKFAKIIGKCNPVAVLATMIWIICTKLLSVGFANILMAYALPAYGSHIIDVMRLGNFHKFVLEQADTTVIGLFYGPLISSIIILFICIIYSTFIMSWQWILRYQDKAIFKCVRFQKFRHFFEPYHAPYTAKFRFWTGLLLFVRFVLYLSPLVGSLNPRVYLMSVIIIVGALILLKGITAKRVYKNKLIDIMETVIYFNLVAFSALMWYTLEFGGNQIAVVYTSVMIIFILFCGVIIFHVLRYTRLYKCTFIQKFIEWTSSKLTEKTPKQELQNDAQPEELDGYQLERSVADDQELPTITYSEVDICQNQEVNYTLLD